MIKDGVYERFTRLRSKDELFRHSFNFTWTVEISLYLECLLLLNSVQIIHTAQPVIPFPFFISFQEADRLKLKSNTKFLARRYFDFYLCNHPFTPEGKLILVVITCLRAAVKFFEKRSFSQQYSIDYAIDQSGGEYKKEEFITCEMNLIASLNFNMKIVTPEDFSDVLSLFPQKIYLSDLTTIFDFFLSQPQVKLATAEEIFFSSLIFLLRERSSLHLNWTILKAIVGTFDRFTLCLEILNKEFSSLQSNQ